MHDWSFEELNRKYARIFESESAAFDRSDGPNEFDMHYSNAYFEYARGFRKAGDRIVQILIEKKNAYTWEMVPAAIYLYRQAAELHLKSIRRLLARKVDERYAYSKNEHNLLKLWEPIREYLRGTKFPFEDGTLHYRVEKYIEELNTRDLLGDRFRYPDSKSAKDEILRIDFEELAKMANELDLLDFGFPETVEFHVI